MASKAQRRLRIARVLPVLDFGGVETLVQVQAERGDRDRFELAVCTLGKPGRIYEALEATGVDRRCLGVDPRVRNPRATLALVRYLKERRPDVVHATVPEADFHAAIASKVLGIPYIIDEAGMPHRKLPGRLAFAAIHRSAAAIVCVSEALREHLIREELAPRQRTHVIGTCASAESFVNPKADYSSGDEFRVVCVGRLAPVKNHEVLIRAVRLLEARGRKIRVEIAGEGPHRQTLEALIRREGVEGRVRLLGYHDDRAGLLRKADLYAIPSHSEGCSLSLLEAMAAAIPVVASRVPGNLEVLGALGGNTAPPEDAQAWVALIEKMADLDASARRALGERGRTIAQERYSPTAYVDAIEALYEAVAREPKRGRARLGG